MSSDDIFGHYPGDSTYYNLSYLFKKYCTEKSLEAILKVFEIATPEQLGSLRFGKYQMSGLHIATRLGDTFVLNKFIDSGMDIDTKNSRNHTAMYFACNEDHVTSLRWLIHRGANVNHIDKYGCSYLFHCSQYKAGKLLLDAGCVCYDPHLFVDGQELRDIESKGYILNKVYKQWGYQTLMYTGRFIGLLVTKYPGPEVLGYLVDQIDNEPKIHKYIRLARKEKYEYLQRKYKRGFFTSLNQNNFHSTEYYSIQSDSEYDTSGTEVDESESDGHHTTDESVVDYDKWLRHLCGDVSDQSDGDSEGSEGRSSSDSESEYKTTDYESDSESESD